MKLEPDRSTPENRAFWNFVKKTARRAKEMREHRRMIFDGKEWINAADHEEVVKTCATLRARVVELERVLAPFLIEAPRWWGGGMGLKDTPTQLTIGDYKAVSEAFMDFNEVKDV